METYDGQGFLFSPLQCRQGRTRMRGWEAQRKCVRCMQGMLWFLLLVRFGESLPWSPPTSSSFCLSGLAKGQFDEFSSPRRAPPARSVAQRATEPATPSEPEEAGDVPPPQAIKRSPERMPERTQELAPMPAFLSL